MCVDPTACAACSNPESDTAAATSLCPSCISYLLLNSRFIPRVGNVLPVEQRRLRPAESVQGADCEGARRDMLRAGHSPILRKQVEGAKDGEGARREKGESPGSFEVIAVGNREVKADGVSEGGDRAEFGVQKVIGKKGAERREEGLLVKAEMRGRGRQNVRRFPLVIRGRSYRGFHEVVQGRFGTGDKLLVEYQDRAGDFVPVAEDDAVDELYRVAQMFQSRVIRLRLGAE